MNPPNIHRYLGRPRAWLRAGLFAALAAVAGTASGAILYLEDFDPDAGGWVGRDGTMTFAHDPGMYLSGSFGASFFPQTDAFRIASGANFLGDYPGAAPDPLTQISFDLVAVNVLPSDLFIRIIDGANVFSYQFSPVNLSDTYVVNLVWSFGWSGISEAAFNAALSSVDAVEIQVTSSGFAAQTYYLDNVQTLDTDLGGDPGGGGGSAVPEPATITLLLMAFAMLTQRRRLLGHRAGTPRAE
jgi:hypothetical protein